MAESNYFPKSDTTSASYEALSNELNTFLTNETLLLDVTQNVFKAHKDCISFPCATLVHNERGSS